jgi:hypothetical protein
MIFKLAILVHCLRLISSCRLNWHHKSS